MTHRILIVMLALVLGGSLPAFSQYADADSLACSCRWHIALAALKLDAEPNIVESVVYPELTRYSALRNEIESSLVNGFYVKFGSEKGDFSIGLFQMKPSFVEALEKKWNAADSLSMKYQIYFNTSNRTEYLRNQRILRMQSLYGQSLYAAMFVKMMLHYFPELKSQPLRKQVRIIATAYNCGIAWPAEGISVEEQELALQKLEGLSAQAKFHTDLVATPFTRFYSYAAIAEEHYCMLSGDKF